MNSAPSQQVITLRDGPPNPFPQSLSSLPGFVPGHPGLPRSLSLASLN